MREQHSYYSNATAGSDLPSVCRQALIALASPYASIDEIGAIVARDSTLTLKLLQSINSAHFGLARKVTNAAEAIALLGFERVKSMLVDLESSSAQAAAAGAFLSSLPVSAEAGLARNSISALARTP